MGKRIARFKLWFHNHVPVPLLLIGAVFVVILLLNEDVSLKRSYAYLHRIGVLKKEIQINQDSAQYYRVKAQELKTSSEQLEHIAREQYHMQKPDEEVYILQ